MHAALSCALVLTAASFCGAASLSGSSASASASASSASASSASASASSASGVPMLLLHNGVKMPAIACGSGGDNNQSAQVTVKAALEAGFTHIDTAHDYGDQAGVGKAVAGSSVFLTTKVPGCGVPTQGLMPPCFNNTLKAVDQDLALLGMEKVSLMLIHFPPLLGCVASSCEHMQQQWAALEQIYHEKKADAIGVSNYCKECLQCIMKTAKVVPMVNQMQYHIGMGGPDFADGLLEFLAENDIAFTAYSPLGGGGVLSPSSPFAAIGNATAAKYKWQQPGSTPTAQPVQPAQVALAWIAQKRANMPQMAVVTKSSNPVYLAEDLGLWSGWGLSAEDRAALDKIANPACKLEAPGSCCKAKYMYQ